MTLDTVVVFELDSHHLYRPTSDNEFILSITSPIVPGISFFLFTAATDFTSFAPNNFTNQPTNYRSPSFSSLIYAFATTAPACTNAYDYGDPVCSGTSSLYWGSGNHSDLSCAHCVCDEGWGGLDCGRCLDISVCPTRTVGGKVGLFDFDSVLIRFWFGCDSALIRVGEGSFGVIRFGRGLFGLVWVDLGWIGLIWVDLGFDFL